MKGSAMAAQPQQRPEDDIMSEQPTRVAIGLLALGVVALIILIAIITLVPARTISESLNEQFRQQQQLIAESLAGRIESYFNLLGNELTGLSRQAAVQSSALASRAEALQNLADLGQRRAADVRAIVRLNSEGRAIYAYPSTYNDLIQANQPLPWTVDQAWLTEARRDGTIKFTRRSSSESGSTYLLSQPLAFGLSSGDLLVFELNLRPFLIRALSEQDFGETTKIWVIDSTGAQLYRSPVTAEFTQNAAPLFAVTKTEFFSDFPEEGRDSYVSPVFTAYTETRQQTPSLILVLSRSATEGQVNVTTELTRQFVLGLSIIAVMVVIGVFTGRFLVREANRRRRETQRRSTARTLLDVSRALNSSLDLNVVLSRILEQLQLILPHDSASVFLVDEDQTSAMPMAERGYAAPDRAKIPLTSLSGASEVFRSGRPLLINDVSLAPLWNPRAESMLVKAWLGVPLRIREQSVGILNINSHTVNRFQPDDVELAEAFADQAGTAIQSARAHELQISVFEAELKTAEMIQQSLMPDEPPTFPQFDIAAISKPARYVSGDFFQYFLLPDGRLGLAVGDISGKGMPAALMMAVVTTALRDEILHTSSPAKLLDELNARLLARMQQNHMNSALLVCVFDPFTRQAELANGGMVQPYLRTSRGWDFIAVGGYPLGASGRTGYGSKPVQFSQGSVLVFVSDGVTDAQRSDRELYGFDRLEALLQGLAETLTAAQIAAEIEGSVRTFLSGEEPDDDLTIVVVKSVDQSIL